jgi:D-alanyl-D-alanine carboxypeptidase
MSSRDVSSWRRLVVAGLFATLTIAGSTWDLAEARAAVRHEARGPVRSEARAPARQAKQARTARKRVIHGANYHPPYAAIVVDHNSGQVLHDEHADEPRRPASLTKIMTLYLLFEQLEAGRLRLDTPLPVSSFAAQQNPTKLGLRADQTLPVEDAIKGLVTKSANDAAVVVSEALAGSEAAFAQLMTQKARALGMTNTVYINASGLPAEEQLTTARDQALLGRAIQDRFPEYYRYFSTLSFRYRGKEMRNHNALLGQVAGVDGIKTGFTEASGYNLTVSVRRDDKHLVAVVLGGTSNAKRDARMRELIERYIPAAATLKTAPKVVETGGQNASFLGIPGLTGEPVRAGAPR